MNKLLILILLLGVFMFPLASSLLTESIFSYYKLEESVNPIIDSILNNNGTILGGSSTTHGKINNGFRFLATESAGGINISNDGSSIYHTDSFTFNAWINITGNNTADGLQLLIRKGITTDADSAFYIFYSDTTNTIKYHTSEVSTSNEDNRETDVINENEWYMITATYNDTSNEKNLYLNGLLNDTIVLTNDLINPDSELLYLGSNSINSFILNGTLDEVGLWNRSLSSTEISELYNGGIGLSYPFSNLQVNLEAPADGINTINSSMFFNASYTSTGLFNLTNATYTLWLSNGTLFNQTTVDVTGVTNQTALNISGLTVNPITWNVEACANNGTSTSCEVDDDNRTLKVGYLIDTASLFNNPVLETSSQMFSVNLTTSNDVTVQTATLIYNGTTFTTGTRTNTAGNNWTLTDTIIIPQVTAGSSVQSKSFTWNITLADINTGDVVSVETSSESQNVNELVFDLCGVGNATDTLLNFTLKDEISGSVIDAVNNLTSFVATFDVGVDSFSKVKNFSVNNVTLPNTNYALCTSNVTDQLFVDMQSTFGALQYSDNSYYLTNATLNSSIPSEIDIFLLLEDSSVEFFVTVLEDLENVPGAIVTVSKFFLGEGLYKTVGIHQTDEVGKFTTFLELDAQYRFSVVKDGDLLGVFERDAICESAPCELSLSLSTGASNPIDTYYDFFADGVSYNITYEPLAKIVTFDFIDTTGLATSFRMDIIQTTLTADPVIINTQQLFTSAGQMTYNASALPDGEYRVEVFISRSPAKLIDFFSFLISTFTNEFGKLGLIFSILLVLVIIFGLSLSPTLLIMAIPISLTLVKVMGFLALGNIALTLIYILAFISITVMNK